MNKFGLSIIISVALLSIFAVTQIEPTLFFITPTSEFEILDNSDKSGKDGAGVSGWVKITVLDEFGNIVAERSNYNLIVTKGLEVTSDLLFGTSHTSGEGVGNMKYIQLGVGTTNPAAGDTNCETPAGSKVADSSIENTATGAIINATWTTQLLGQSISEICLTDSTTNATGNLFARQEYTPIPISGTYTVNAEWTITFEDSDGS